MVSMVKGYKCIVAVSSKSSPDKIDMLKAMGAKVYVCPANVPADDKRSYYQVAKRLNEEIKDSFYVNQYFNELNIDAHYKTTGPEIWEQTNGKVTHFVAGAGTGGTLCGVGKYLKEKNPNIQIIAADPEGSVYSGGDGRPYLVEGVGEDFWPDTYDPAIIDRVIAVSDAKSFHRARQVSQEEGLLIGGSCGTAVEAAIAVASELTEKEMVVVLLPDSGRGYLSKIYNDEWMTDYGFLSKESPNLGEVLASKSSKIPPLIHLQPQDTLGKAIETMHQYSVSQVIVAQGNLPLSAAEVKGVISKAGMPDGSLLESSLNNKCLDWMEPSLQNVGVGESISTVEQLLEKGKKLLVFKDGQPFGIVSYSDVAAYFDQLGSV